MFVSDDGEETCTCVVERSFIARSLFKARCNERTRCPGAREIVRSGWPMQNGHGRDHSNNARGAKKFQRRSSR